MDYHVVIYKRVPRHRTEVKGYVFDNAKEALELIQNHYRKYPKFGQIGEDFDAHFATIDEVDTIGREKEISIPYLESIVFGAFRDAIYIITKTDQYLIDNIIDKKGNSDYSIELLYQYNKLKNRLDNILLKAQNQAQIDSKRRNFIKTIDKELLTIRDPIDLGYGSKIYKQRPQ